MGAKVLLVDADPQGDASKTFGINEESGLTTPGVITLERLRSDIAKYLDMLCLNPKIFEKTTIKEKPKLSKLDAALSKIADG